MTSVETKKNKDKMMTALFTAGATFAVILLIAFVLYVVVSGVSGMTPQLLSFSPTGLGNMFFNTIYLVVLALVASTIAGIPAGIFLAEYAKKGRITHWVRMAVETLASLPSIVVGFSRRAVVSGISVPGGLEWPGFPRIGHGDHCLCFAPRR